MSFFRTHNNGSVATPQYTGLQLQTASSALPIPIVYGITRAAPNLIWSGNFQSHPQYSQVQGGKGGGGSSATITGYTYTCALVFALGEGPITAIGTVFQGGGLYTAAQFSLSLFTGSTPQAPWGYLSASAPQAALSYQGTAYAASPSFNLGSSASIDSIAFEIYGRLYPTAVVNAHDADPALVIADFLTNAQYGVGFPAASLDATSLYGSSGDGSYQTYCQAMGLAFSPCLSDQETANATLTRWLQITNATAIWSGGRLKIIPLGDAPATGALQGGTITFQPNTTPVMNLCDDDFLHDDDADPVLVSRVDPYAASNVQRLEILDRSNQYAATPVEAHDQNAIELYGLRIGATITAHEICDLNVASVSVQLILRRGLYIRNSYAFRLSWDYCLLEPMDIVTLNDAGLGLAMTPVRIVSVEEDAAGLLSVTAEEFPGVVATAQAYAVAGATNNPLNRNVAPASVNPPFLFEPPSDLTGGTSQIWIGVSGGTNGTADPNWGGATIYVSTDGASYAQLGSVSAPARQGVLTAALGTPATGKATDTLAISFAESAGVVTSIAGNPLFCVVDGEIIGATSATLAAASTYTLAGLTRQVYGGRGGAHAPGTAAIMLDNALFKYTVPPNLIGQPVYLKFASFNMFGGAAQDLSTCAAYAITPVGSGLFGPVASAIAIGGSMDDGLASAAIGETDTYGLASDPYTDMIDMGLASDGASSLAVASGGTGATTPVAARQNIGGAASGANTDITSLGALTRIGFATQAITIDPATGHVGLAGYTADSNNGVGALGTSFLFNAAVDSCRFTFNKMASANDASLTFETNYSARALMGTTGSDQFQLKVSPDGSTFFQVYVVDQTTGNAAFKALLGLAPYTVASLPSASFNGAVAFAGNGRKIGEATGSGSGVAVAYSNGAWRRLSDDTIVAS